MFYSQTFLARKGPLGTVWTAAHLQHRLKKSHYTSTDIPSTVDRILFSEVPIALRMSGHLMLGVVRIYSKKVEYLFQDCNDVLNALIKAFATIDVNLPENATTAKFESVTVPQSLDFDALDPSNYMFPDGSADNNLRSKDDITFTDEIPTSYSRNKENMAVTDQIPIGYIAIRFDEDIMMDASHSEQDPNSDARPMKDSHQLPLEDVLAGTTDFQDPGPSNQTQVLENEDLQDPGPSSRTDILTGSPGNQTEFNNSPSEIEVMMRDTASELQSENIPPVSPHGRDHATAPNRTPDQPLHDRLPSPIMEDAFQQHSKPPASGASQDAPEIANTSFSFGNISPRLGIRSTPPVQQPQPKRRKRKGFFDEDLVLTNKIIKKGLADSSDLLRNRKPIPSSALGIWRLNNSLRKDQIFYEPLVTGSCADICNLLKKGYISTKSHLTFDQEGAASGSPEAAAIPGPRNANSPASATEPMQEPMLVQSRVQGPDNEHHQRNASHDGNTEIDEEIEVLRHDGGHDGNDFLFDFLPSPSRPVPSPGKFVPSPGRADFTPMPESNLGSERVPLLHAPDMSPSPGTYQGAQSTGLSDIHELINTPGVEDLDKILEADSMTAESQCTGGIDSLSVRTRAVAKYLKGHSPITPMSEDASGDISLNNILQGKTRKICARMFFETLVLKSYELIDVHQELPYGDITLKLTATLSKAEL